jgi:type VI secretion system protein ImpC
MSTIKFSLDEPAAQAGRPPLRLAVLAEFMPRVYESGQPDEHVFRFPVDKDNFNETMAKAGLRLKFDIKNPLGPAPKELHIDLPLNLIKALRPDNIVRTVPAMRSLLEVRELLVEVAQRSRTLADFAVRVASHDQLPQHPAEAIAAILSPPRKGTGKTPPAPPPAKSKPRTSGADVVDNILDMIDTGDDQTPPVESGLTIKAALDEYIRGDRKPAAKVNIAAVQKAITALDEALGRGVDAIIHHPEFKRVERLWRGLKFLIDQTDFRKDIKLEIINAHQDNLPAVFTGEIHQPEYEGLSETPLAAALLIYEFTAANPDIDLLRTLAGQVAEIPLVVFGSVGGSFFGLENAGLMLTAPSLSSLLDGPGYIKFNGLRDEPASRWLALAFNRFQLRFPYGHEGWAIKSFGYREQITAWEDITWGNPVWGLAANMTRSYAQSGWPTQIARRETGRMLENLPVHALALPDGEAVTVPLETIITDQRLQEFDKNGIIPLLCDINMDSAYILAAPSVYRPRHDADANKAEMNALMASLPYQLYAGDIARTINRRYNELTSGAPAAECESRVAQMLAAHNVTRDDPGIPGRITTRTARSTTDPNKLELALEINSPPGILHGRAVVRMSLPLRS